MSAFLSRYLIVRQPKLWLQARVTYPGQKRLAICSLEETPQPAKTLTHTASRTLSKGAMMELYLQESPAMIWCSLHVAAGTRVLRLFASSVLPVNRTSHGGYGLRAIFWLTTTATNITTCR